MSGRRSNRSNPALPGQLKSSMLAPIKTPGTSPAARGGNDHEKTGFDRRDFLKTAVASGAAAASATTTIATPECAQADQPAQAPAAATEPAGYAFLNLDEAAFVEALVDHMIPADEISPKGTDLGVNIYIDRALAGAWGKGDRLYMQGPVEAGRPEPGLPAAADAGTALSRRHRGDQRALPQDLRQYVRPDHRGTAAGGPDRALHRQDHLR